MSPAGRRYRVTKPGIKEQAQPAVETTQRLPKRGGRRLKVVTPGIKGPAAQVQPVPRPAAEAGMPRMVSAAAQAGSDARMPAVEVSPAPAPQAVRPTPGRAIPRPSPVPTTRPTESPTPIPRPLPGPRPANVTAPRPTPVSVQAQKPQKPVIGVKRRSVSAKSGSKKPGKARLKKRSVKRTPITLNAADRRILAAVDKGSANIQTLTKRTSLPQNLLMPAVKKLSEAGYILTKRIKGIKKYKLSNRGYDHLHPPKFPFSLFKPKRRRGRARRRRLWGRRLTRRQRIRRLDFAIGTLLSVLIILVAYQSYIFLGLTDDGDDGNTDGTIYVDDTTKPVIIWQNQPMLFEDPFATLSINLQVYDPGESPSGIDPKKVKVQYAFASSQELSEPNLSNWSQIAPYVNLPYVNASLRRNWTPLDGNFIFIRCFAFDNNNNAAMETFKILIYL